MRVSIWQQFSSNHSSSFTVVGQFASVEEANAAAKEFRELLVQVEPLLEITRAAWKKAWEKAATQTKSRLEQHDIVSKQFPNARELTKPEREFSEKYNIEWDERGIDWLHGDYPLSELIKVVNSDVFVMSNKCESYWYTTPIMISIVRLGARSVTSGCSDSRRGFLSQISVALSCTTPDANTATNIIQSIKTHLDWDYFDQKATSWEKILTTLPEIPWMPKHIVEKLDYQIVGGFKSSVKNNNNNIECYIQFGRAGFGLPAFIQWLEGLGCTNIKYKLNEDREITPR
jgi:hypothetical protein